ncbi:MAG: Trk system potassium transporter TrkA [Tissierellaceae bacterium]|nr:Trk system potassium transporter TrkA [Tissierellaceae bacterium]
MRVVIVGAGKLGYKLAESMIQEDIDVTLIDINPYVLDRINEHMDVLTIEANGIDIRVLKEIEINRCDILVATTDSDETNTVVCTLAKKLGCKKTIARIRNPEYMKQLDFIKSEMGIDLIVNPDLDTAKFIEKFLLKQYMFYTGEFASGKVKIIDYNIGHNFDLINKKLKDLVGFENLLIAAISRDGNIIIPHGDTELLEYDVIYLIGTDEHIDEFNNRFNLGKINKEIENVMILGGSNIGYYLSKALVKSKISVRLIEIDKDRATELSNKLDDVLIIHGDGTDFNLLDEEMLGSMDAFIGTTGFDEQNLLMALVAKQEGVNKCIAKISRQNYIKVIDRLGIDAALNPIYITASNILKYIRGGKVISVSLLIGGDGEVTELIVGKDSPFINKPLSELNLPKSIIIGAIVRDGKVTIPKGNSIIKADDRIVVFCLTEDVPILKKFFLPQKGGILSELWNRNKSSRNSTNN